MLEEIKYTETHLRTIAKLVVYRVIVIITLMLMVLAAGGSDAQAGAVGLAVLIVGSIVYYLHDRVWMLFPWARSADANDAKKRSLVKTICYRLIIMVVAFITFKVVGMDNQQSAGLAVIQAVVNMFFYYAVERVFNRLSWGKVPVQPAVTA
jgi:uncharacterized membrane protein